MNEDDSNYLEEQHIATGFIDLFCTCHLRVIGRQSEGSLIRGFDNPVLTLTLTLSLTLTLGLSIVRTRPSDYRTLGLVSARHSEGPSFSAISSSDNLRPGIRLGLGLGLVVWLWQTIPCNDHE